MVRAFLDLRIKAETSYSQVDMLGFEELIPIVHYDHTEQETKEKLQAKGSYPNRRVRRSI